MKEERILSILNQVDEKYIKEAEPMNKTKKKNNWMKWGAMAACLCLVVAGLATTKLPGIFSDSGAGVHRGGTLPEGIDSVIASTAVFPATKTIDDVADATVNSMTEADAKNVDVLGEYLPDTLPAGYNVGDLSLYETTMKDGTKYYMLRVTYTTGENVSHKNEGAEETVGNPDAWGDSFVFFVLNYEPENEKKMYTPESISDDVLAEIAGSTFYISYGDIYVGITPNAASADELRVLVDSIK